MKSKQELLTPEQAAKVLFNVTPRVLARWQGEPNRPPCVRLPSGEVRYDARAVFKWCEKEVGLPVPTKYPQGRRAGGNVNGR